MSESKIYYVYILRCADGTLYTGIALDVRKRVIVHNSGQGAKYTRARRPVKLAYSEMAGSRSEAMRREVALKKLPRAQKLRLIKQARAQ